MLEFPYTDKHRLLFTYRIGLHQVTPLGVVFLFMLVNWWVEKHQRFYSTFTNVFFIFVTFLRFFNVFLFFLERFFYIYGSSSSSSGRRGRRHRRRGGACSVSIRFCVDIT